MRDRLVLREDFELIVSFAHRILFVFLDFLLTKQNGRGHVLRCSHFQPAEYLENDETDDIQKLRPKSDPFPCVIYCHGNAGSRVDALPLLPVFLPHGISVCSFDFAGAGQSEGQYLSLGHFEKEDLRTVIEFLMSSKRVSRIGLWAHSMGASSCLLYAADGAAWSSRTETDAPPPPAKEEAPAFAPVANEKKTHTVVAGDTLFNIAEQYLGDGNRYTELAAANNIANPDHIEVGQVITIP